VNRRKNSSQLEPFSYSTTDAWKTKEDSRFFLSKMDGAGPPKGLV